jgi:hypothetical protein
MRALRVVGLGIDGRTVILEAVAPQSGERGERFTLPVDDGLHAAVRGDLPRLGQIEIELESQMRPREIQARIRAGASVEQVAAAAGVPSQRIERFAYPVLLERSRIAKLAQQAHPVRADGPDVRTLEEVVTETFRRRGHDYGSVNWDSWRGENGKWVVALRWRAGRSDNRAHWTFHPGAHGGTVTAVDDHATELVDPQPAAQLRTVPPVARPEEPVADQRPSARAVPDDGPAYRPAQRPSESSDPPIPPKRARKDRPTIPSWEDVLLGVRSPPGS